MLAIVLGLGFLSPSMGFVLSCCLENASGVTHEHTHKKVAATPPEAAKAAPCDGPAHHCCSMHGPAYWLGSVAAPLPFIVSKVEFSSYVLPWVAGPDLEGPFQPPRRI